MKKAKNLDIYIKQERRIIDGVEGGAHELHDEFLEKIRSNFTHEEAKKIIDSGYMKVKLLNHIGENILSALQLGKQNTITSDTVTIEVTIQDQLIGLLYERRTQLNNAEITYTIFNEKLQKLKKQVLKAIK